MPVVNPEEFYSDRAEAHDRKHALENQPQGFIDVLERFVELGNKPGERPFEVRLRELLL